MLRWHPLVPVQATEEVVRDIRRQTAAFEVAMTDAQDPKREKSGIKHDRDWHSAEYVGDWLRRDEARKPVLRWKPSAPAQAAE